MYLMVFITANSVKACYNSWNEHPEEIIRKNTTKVLPLSTPRMPPLLKNVPPMLFSYSLSQLPVPFIPGFNIPYPIPPHAILKSRSVFSKVPILPTPPITPQMPSRLTPPHPLPMKDPIVEYIDDEFGRRRKYSPEQLIKIQERVIGSLQAQGVVCRCGINILKKSHFINHCFFM